MTVGMYFSLRGGQEHYDLKVDQFKRVPAEGYSKETHYRYVENGSKNYQGRFSECNKSCLTVLSTLTFKSYSFGILLLNIQYWSYCTPTTIQEIKVCAAPLIRPRKSQ